MQLYDTVRVVNALSPHYERVGEVIAIRQGTQPCNPLCTVRFSNGVVHEYEGDFLNRLNRTQEELALAAMLAAMTPEELLAYIDRK